MRTSAHDSGDHAWFALTQAEATEAATRLAEAGYASEDVLAFHKEIQDGVLTWDDGDHRGTYSVEWLPADQSQATWAALGITLDDF